MTKKNIIFISISLVLTLLLGIGVSYSMWNITVNQDTVSTMHTDCFDLTISNKENNISLENAYPISNDKGIKLAPYTFTVTNTCDITAQYSINLEVLKESTLSSKFIDVMLDGNINLLSSYDETDKIDNSSIESRKIDTGILKSNESKDYSLRLWIDYDTTLEALNNETKIFKSKVTIIGEPISYIDDTVFNFDYTGSEQVFTVPVSGIYKLETWGAQGGKEKGMTDGGSGGYSNGIIKLDSNKIIYINVGSTDIKKCSETSKGACAGGYNGGGNSFYFSNERWGSGGGATHISLKSGLLSSLENYKSDILIVSGGGGGAYHAATGGAGGGFKGNSGFSSRYGQAIGGTQISGGSGSRQGSFGHGGICDENGLNCSGGGGGYYGGGGNDGTSGAGGSGYIGNSLLKNKVMYCYNCEESSDESTKTISTACANETPTSNCAKLGNGYARITLISIDE